MKLPISVSLGPIAFGVFRWNGGGFEFWFRVGESGSYGVKRLWSI